MKRYERPRKWVLLEEPFSVTNQTLTAKLSLRRHNIVKHYKPIIDGLYDNTHGYGLSEETERAKAEEEVA
jgi:long-subunit acyl-CoA synthetase (AMP-forming)